MKEIAAFAIMLILSALTAHAQNSSVKPAEDERLALQRVMAETYQEAVSCRVENLSFTADDVASIKAYFKRRSDENGLDQAVRDDI